MKHTQKVSQPRPPLYISAATVQFLYPGLPLDDLTDHKGSYDSLAVFDLAEAMGLRHQASPDPAGASETGEDLESGLPFVPDWKLVQVDEMLVEGKPYFSTRITAQRTGYSPDRLRRLAGQAGSGIVFVRCDVPNGTRGAMFFDLDSVLA